MSEIRPYLGNHEILERDRAYAHSVYRAGAIDSAPLQPTPEVCPGSAIAATEPHRPGQLDLFIHYDWTGDLVPTMPADYIDYKDWPDLLGTARSFATKHNSPRLSAAQAIVGVSDVELDAAAAASRKAKTAKSFWSNDEKWKADDKWN
ncbi:hypothetical protein GE09DRAFT_1067729 [Coniochaeta sp. 2T2.1]|nr:hypothetical protein GE09DRAFT_1067729 [Coniochaeta sp. 2T2.1]